MRKSVVHYTLERCIRCMKCVKACPTSALSMSDDRVIIDQKRCINCGRCIMACHNRGILAQGSTLDDIENYDYTICLVPGALVSHCASLEEAEDLFHAIRLLGFDEVVDITQYTALHLKEVSLLAEENEGDPYIASFCPVIARLIQNSHKSLLDALLPVKNCSEIAAMDLRKKYAHIKNLGIFNLCECESKLELAKCACAHRYLPFDPQKHAQGKGSCILLQGRPAGMQSPPHCATGRIPDRGRV